MGGWVLAPYNEDFLPVWSDKDGAMGVSAYECAVLLRGGVSIGCE